MKFIFLADLQVISLSTKFSSILIVLKMIFALHDLFEMLIIAFYVFKVSTL